MTLGRTGTVRPSMYWVQQHPDGTIEVSAIDCTESVQAIGNSQSRGVAVQVQAKLIQVMENLENQYPRRMRR